MTRLWIRREAFLDCVVEDLMNGPTKQPTSLLPSVCQPPPNLFKALVFLKSRRVCLACTFGLVAEKRIRKFFMDLS
jgi:hypothetical protein